jgi:signal transduction histidine kinase
VRATLSSIALGMYSSTETVTAAQHPAGTNAPFNPAISSRTPDSGSLEAGVPPPLEDRDGLVHDARNLIGTLGLYCDLLSRPGVLQPEHRQYAEDLRLVGTRSEAPIERLFERIGACTVPARRAADSKAAYLAPTTPRTSPEPPRHPTNLRKVVERCSGLLQRVSEEHEIQINFGEAASLEVRIAEDAIERILVNLVRNAASALKRLPVPSGGARMIRIGVGVLGNGLGEPKPWPFRHVRLTVEDSGCGMSPQRLAQLLSGAIPTSETHGIGFRVVRELVAASHGDLRIGSQPGVGTHVQVDWPIAPLCLDRMPDYRKPLLALRPSPTPTLPPAPQRLLPC